MSKSRTIHLSRRLTLAVPALIAAAVALVAKPAKASAPAPECLADVLGES
jgi:hypothetical protein